MNVYIWPDITSGGMLHDGLAVVIAPTVAEARKLLVRFDAEHTEAERVWTERHEFTAPHAEPVCSDCGPDIAGRWSPDAAQQEPLVVGAADGELPRVVVVRRSEG